MLRQALTLVACGIAPARSQLARREPTRHRKHLRRKSPQPTAAWIASCPPTNRAAHARILLGQRPSTSFRRQTVPHARRRQRPDRIDVADRAESAFARCRMVTQSGVGNSSATFLRRARLRMDGDIFDRSTTSSSTTSPTRTTRTDGLQPPSFGNLTAPRRAEQRLDAGPRRAVPRQRPLRQPGQADRHDQQHLPGVPAVHGTRRQQGRLLRPVRQRVRPRRHVAQLDRVGAADLAVRRLPAVDQRLRRERSTSSPTAAA